MVTNLHELCRRPREKIRDNSHKFVSRSLFAVDSSGFTIAILSATRRVSRCSNWNEQVSVIPSRLPVGQIDLLAEFLSGGGEVILDLKIGRLRKFHIAGL